MSEKRFCPECGHPLEDNERYCSDCGADTMEAHMPDNVTGNGDNGENEPAVIGNGARANIMGNVSSTNNSHKITNTSTTNNTQTNNSNIDNSSTINNTTIVMGGGKNSEEYCGVCGNPLDGHHAKCPRCGRIICLECKVKNKNRCIECEKKAVNEYRLAFQQLILTTGGNIGVAGRQMMDQKARELDVEDRKKEIETELENLYTAPKNTGKFTPQSLVDDNRHAENRNDKATDNDGNGNRKWITYLIYAFIVCIIAIGAIIFFGQQKDGKDTVTEQHTEKVETVSEPDKIQKETVKQETVKQETVKQETVKQKTDEKYAAGIEAYNSGNGLEAVRLFKESGSAESYYMLGTIYEKGCGTVGKNAMMARKHFKKAAEMGNAEAKEKL